MYTPLSIGILHTEPVLMAWECALLEKLKGNAAFSVVYTYRISPLLNGDVWINKVIKKIYRQFDNYFFPLPTLHTTFPLIDCESISEKVDIILFLGRGKVDKRWENLTKMGIVFVTDVNGNDGFSSVIETIFSQKPTFEVQLRLLSAGKCYLLSTSNGKTDTLSANRQYQATGANLTFLFWDYLEKIHTQGVSQLFTQSVVLPSNVSYPTFLPIFSLLYHFIKKAALRFFSLVTHAKKQERWVLLKGKRKELPFPTLSDCEIICASDEQFWADPFPVIWEGKTYIFVEEGNMSDEKGHISVVYFCEETQQYQSKIILQKPYHLSYPFVFQEENTWYMIPETHENEQIDLYKSTHFPFEWEFAHTIMTGVRAVDTTLIKHQGKFWLFTNLIRDKKMAADELFIFHSDALESEQWQAHKKNPVLSDVMRARNAGTIFVYGEYLYRPSQIGAPRYGFGCQLNTITLLTMNEYKEEIVSQITANEHPHFQAVHTYNCNDTDVWLDAFI